MSRPSDDTTTAWETPGTRSVNALINQLRSRACWLNVTPGSSWVLDRNGWYLVLGSRPVYAAVEPTCAGSGSPRGTGAGVSTGWVVSPLKGSCAIGTRIGKPAPLVPAVTGSRWTGIASGWLGERLAGWPASPPRDHHRVPLPAVAALPRAAAPMMSSAREGPRRAGVPPFNPPAAGGPEVCAGAPETGGPETGGPETGGADTGGADTGAAGSWIGGLGTDALALTSTGGQADGGVSALASIVGSAATAAIGNLITPGRRPAATPYRPFASDSGAAASRLAGRVTWATTPSVEPRRRTRTPCRAAR
jgi:hypothetical protein